MNELGIRNYELGIKVEPNPVDEQTAISYQLSAKGNVNIGIYEILGKEVDKLGIRNWKLGIKGENRVLIDTEKLRSGIYFVKVETDNKIGVAKFIKE